VTPTNYLGTCGPSYQVREVLRSLRVWYPTGHRKKFGNSQVFSPNSVLVNPQEGFGGREKNWLFSMQWCMHIRCFRCTFLAFWTKKDSSRVVRLFEVNWQNGSPQFLGLENRPPFACSLAYFGQARPAVQCENLIQCHSLPRNLHGPSAVLDPDTAFDLRLEA
jgi:hypothetical protein